MLSLTLQTLGDVALFRCGGRITADDANRLRTAFLAQSEMRTAVLDLAEITAIDAAGLGVLISLRQWTKTTGRQLKLMNLRPAVVELFDLTKLTSEFEVCSVGEMFDLMCRAAEHSRLEALDAAGDNSSTAQEQPYSQDDRRFPAA